MRLHSLEATAFGPFADAVRVDFDALSDAGLFLLSGPTGAGKSSVLDAVCFALYGDVPGDRSAAKRLRCDLADEGVVPRVLLEVTLSGRRFRIDRSPAWMRAKRRGTGTTTEQARVVISERSSGAADATWRPLSTRLDETGHLVTSLIGMNLAQFCQVAMLPQGRFQAFLRAGSEERHTLLQQVFHTGRFDQVEAWLRNRRVELRRVSLTHQEHVADRVSRVSEVAASGAPQGWEDEPEVLTTWLGHVADTTGEMLKDAAADLAEAITDQTSAKDAESEGRAVAQAIDELREAQAEKARLDTAEVERLAAGARLDSARRATAVRPLHRITIQAEARVQKAHSDRCSALDAVATLTGARVDDVAGLAALRREAVAGLGDVGRVQPLHAHSNELAAAREEADGVLLASRQRIKALQNISGTLPEKLSAIRKQMQVLSVSAARVQDLGDQLATLQVRAQAASLAEDLAQQAHLAEAERVQSLTELQGAKESWLDLRERRLEGMAAEIASALVVGGSCPVCGSADHPSPATADHDAPDADSERGARKVVDDLEVALTVRTQHVRDIDSQLARARGTAGADLASLPQSATACADALSQAKQDAETLETLSGDLSSAESQLADALLEREQLTALTAQQAATCERLARDHESARAAVTELLEGTGCADLGQLGEHHRAIEEATTNAEEALGLHRQAAQAHDEALGRAASAANEAGFPSLTDALTAWLTDEDHVNLERWVADHDRARAGVHDLLATDPLREAAGATVPDLAVLARAHQAANDRALLAQRTHHSLTERNSRLRGLGTDLEGALSRWAPAISELERTASLAGFVEGKHPDNRLQMRLSAYVLAHRLSQVVSAANLRLVSMSDQRFSLIHTGQRGVGERRGGLSLLIRDDWSGESRDPATLSGGETFVVSLALALGLSDVITAEAGGADLDTLFVDEGFGSLDADTLDDVMDTLDSLRDGGRVVGVVSHVQEMQTRIPTQLRVHKARHGSHVTQ